MEKKWSVAGLERGRMRGGESRNCGRRSQNRPVQKVGQHELNNRQGGDGRQSCPYGGVLHSHHVSPLLLHAGPCLFRLLAF